MAPRAVQWCSVQSRATGCNGEREAVCVDVEQTRKEESKEGTRNTHTHTHVRARERERVRAVCQVIREWNLEARIACGSTQPAEEETGKQASRTIG